MNPLLRRLLLLGAILVAVFLTGSLLLQQPDWCVSPDGSPVGCAEITLDPAAATGDFYVDGVLIAAAQNPARLVLTPDVDHTIEIKNIQSTETNFGTLFNYADTSTTIKVTAGELKAKTVKLTKNYIRGTLSFTCDIKNAAATDVVACRVTIDGAVQPDVAAGQVASYILDLGDRVVLVEIIGDQASLFDPANKQQTVNIKAGKTTNLKVTFTKKGHLFLALDQPGVLADFYVDGTLVATQVPTFDLWVAPKVNHKVEAKAFTDPAAAGLYTWKDASKNVTVSAGADKTVTFALQKKWLKGFLELTCDIKNYAGEDVICNVSIDGVPQGTIAAAQVTTYTLDPGSHTVDTTLSGANANLWAPSALSQSVTITASGTPKKLSATFKKAGHLIVSLDQAGVVGDFYLDGTLVATQAAGFAQWVTPSTSHKVEVKNLTDPAAAGVYSWKDASKTVTVKSGEEKALVVALQKQYLKGFLELTCDVKNYAGEDVRCSVAIDGVPQGDIAATQAATYTLDPGSHTVDATLSGGNASLWAPPTLSQSVTITASATPKKVKATFQKAGHLTITLNQPGVVGDFYIDGVLVAGQVPSTAQWVTPNTTHTVEVKNVNDPAAQGVYRWKDASTTARLTPGQEKTVTLTLVKEWLKGFLVITCNITDNDHPDVALLGCTPVIDGVPQGAIPAGQSATYTLDPGQHTIDVRFVVIQWYKCGKVWYTNLDPVTKNIVAGQTTTYTATFSVWWEWWC